MTDDLFDLDRRARAAARGLHDHVREHVDIEQSLHELTIRRPAPRRRVAAVAAAVLLVAGSVAVLGGRADERSRVELDEQVLDLEPGKLRPLGPNDGLDSVQLPVTAEPNAELRDGDTITVSATGFEPGERVGIVQCAREAGGATREVRGGVDGCYLGAVQYADADPTGAATGTYVVSRVLTTPMTGTVDCAAEADRCIVAMGALADYDRSGGTPLRFVGGGEPLHIPTIAAEPAVDLRDGQAVHVEGDGFEPGELLDLLVCATDPSGCWQTGPPVALEAQDQRGEGEMPGLRADADGRVNGEVAVWRFLPSSEAGTYIDCAVSRCSLRIISQHVSPPTIPLGFAPGGEVPRAPALRATPTEGLAPGDTILVEGAGFTPAAILYVSICAGPPGEVEMRYTCASADDSGARATEDGTFTMELEVPDLGSYETMPEPGAPAAGPQPIGVRCDGIDTDCAVFVESYPEVSGLGPPMWMPVPVPITFR